MGPAADRAQGALREMASALLAPDRLVSSQAELALRSGGREMPPITPFLPKTEEPAAAPLAQMTAREREVLIGVALGYSSKRIAGNLGRSVKTIEKHRFKMMHKLGLRNTAAVTRYAMDHGLLDADGDTRELHPARLPPKN